MLAGVVAFVCFPQPLIRIFSHTAEVLSIGKIAFPIIGASFVPAAFSLMTPVFFQAVGSGKISMGLSLLRQMFCLIPFFWLFSKIGLSYTWCAFPVSEIISGAVGLILYRKVARSWKMQ